MMRYLVALMAIFLWCPVQAQSGKSFYAEADTLYDHKDYTGALAKINKAIKLSPDNADYLTKRGVIFEALEKNREAYDSYSEAIKANPKCQWAYSQRGLLLSAGQETDMALTDLNKALKLATTDSSRNMCLVNRATALIGDRRFGEAYDDLMKVYQSDSNDIAMLTDLAAICDEIGKGDQTLKYLLRVIKIDPSFFAAYGNIGFKYQDMGDHKKAIEYYDKVLQFKPDEPMGFSNRAYNKMKIGDLKGAYADIERSISLYPANSYAYRIRGMIYLEDHKPDKACKDFETALERGFTKMYGEEVLLLRQKHCLK